MIAPDGSGGKRLQRGKWPVIAARKRGGTPPLPMVAAQLRHLRRAGITASLGES
jgi:hypothetical protein